MSLADALPRVILEADGEMAVTLAGTVSRGDLIGYSTGWKQADGNSSPAVRAFAVAGEDGVSGDVIKAWKWATVEGYTGGTAGAAVYLSDTAGTISESPSGTTPQAVGFLASATVAYLNPQESAAATTVSFADDTDLIFGGSSDVQIEWDTAATPDQLQFLPLADDTVISFGVAAATQLSCDIKIFGNAANGADYVLFDASASRMDMVGAYALGLHYRKPVVAKTTDYTCLATESGSIYTNIGASGTVIYTLPAVTETGWTAKFIACTTAQTFTIASAEGNNMVVFNDIAASSISAATTSEKAGWGCEVISTGALWLVFEYIHDAQTSTIV